MSSAPNPFGTRQTFTAAGGRAATFYSIPRLEKEGVGPVSRLPVSLRVVLESLLPRHARAHHAERREDALAHQLFDRRLRRRFDDKLQQLNTLA